MPAQLRDVSTECSAHRRYDERFHGRCDGALLRIHVCLLVTVLAAKTTHLHLALLAFILPQVRLCTHHVEMQLRAI